ncbi:MAG: D-glycero-beta-D-manno-heptose 1,7-bisphosphate 7-phosphatase [Candidatus Omnitrophica bacterium]|nr:D-glycero-beta-D-manno-heptose 1,7-bisphosphate 7-phosphatase [Candidatus Omnitrophota bacterium]
MKIIFLDRDGVINKDPAGWTEHSYVTRLEDFIFLPGSREAIKRLTEAGYEIVIISNQAGINRGFFTKDDLKKINDNMLKNIESSGGKIRSAHYCPHTKEERCACRKPNTGLFKEATKNLDIDFNGAFFIGDGSMDIEAGESLGCKTILVLSGKSGLLDVKEWKTKPDFIKKDLAEAVEWMLNKSAKRKA